MHEYASMFDNVNSYIIRYIFKTHMPNSKKEKQTFIYQL